MMDFLDMIPSVYPSDYEGAKADRLRQAELAVLEAAEKWVDLFERHVDHEVPMLPHNRAMWEAVRNLKAERGK